MISTKLLALLLTLLSTHGTCREVKQLGLAQNATVLNCEIDDPTECQFTQSCVPISSSSGICATPPISGAVISTDPATFPIPTAYFPLTGQTLDSWPTGQYNGTLRGAVWRQDPEFGSVLHCKEGLNDLIQLENVPIGAEGPFTVNLWLKKAVTSSFFGSSHQFVFSVGKADQERNGSFDPASRNQLHLFLPEERNPRHGLIRAIVKDDNDDETEVYYMDSDGRVNDDVLRNDSLPHVELADGQWHMLTVSSIPSRRGFRIFIDGEMVAETPTRTGPSGGDPMVMDGRLHLCGRIDEAPDRHFDGSLAKLTIFEQTLTKRQIRVLFESVKSSTLENQIQSSQRLQDWNQRTNSTSFVDEELGVRYIRGPEVDQALIGRSDSVDASLTPLQFNLRQFLRNLTLCPLNADGFGLDPEDFCTGNEVCTPVHPDTLVLLHEMSNLTRDEAFGLTGICAETPQGGAIWPGLDTGFPLPLAYFPLIEGGLDSWPIPNARGVAIAAEIVEDPVFGSVFECSQRNQSFLILDNVPYGESGSFAFSLWFQALDLEGNSFQYLLSHGPVSPMTEVWGPNQVQVFLGEANHSTSGVVRAIVKDSGDVDGGRMFLDSDGDVGLVESKDPDRTRNQLVNISDSSWHMLTISTRRDSRKGFSMFLDGRFIAEIRDDVIYTGDDGEVLEANGGQAFRPGGKIYLCGRYDGIPTRHFTGRIAELMFFDQPLFEDQVANLYGAALRAQPGLINGGRKLLQQDEQETEIRNPGSWWGIIDGQSGARMGSCLLQIQDCDVGLTCVPVRSSDETQGSDRTGICVNYPSNGAYIFNSDSEIEVPIGYFPLINGSLDSWPFPTFAGNASSGVQFVEDEVFGSVLDCSETTQDHVILDNVPFVSETGAFTVAFWIRQHSHHLNDSSDFGFEFVFSQISGSNLRYTGLTDPGQIQVLVPRSDAGLPGRVRAVVRDEEDENGDLIFLDSSEDSQVDLNDGLWHMVAISSRPRGNKGYRVFVDGVLVNELRGRGATGGGPMMLTSKIQLCRRADGANGTYFDGNLAHLILWDSALTQTQLFALYERFILASEGVQLDHPVRQTIEGDPCVFPGILKGQIYIDCAPLDEVLKCPVRNGTWVECSAFNESSLATFNTSIVRQTIDGEVCMMPGVLNGREVFGCAKLRGRFSCQVRPGQWKECAPLLKLRYTVSGAPCVFPFTFEGRQHSDCYPTDNDQDFCQIANGEYQTCAPAVFQEGVEDSMGQDLEDHGPAPVLVDQVISRIATNGDICSFPFWFEGRSVGSCVELRGNEVCQTRNGTMELCLPLTYTTEGTPCAFPFPADSTMNFGCINRRNDDVCRVANGSFASCDLDSLVTNQTTNSIPILPGRVTRSNESCSFPFWSEGKLVSDCVGDSMERCMTEKGVLKECRPKRLTQNGNQCSFPFRTIDSLAFDCVMLGGLEQCRTANGSMEICVPVPRGPSMDRFSIQGIPCSFPFFYNGTEMQDCVLIGNEESCKISGDEWATCAPLVEAKVFQRRTRTGQECLIPFQYENRIFTDCFRDENGEELCRTEDAEGPLEECAPKADNNRGMNEFVQYPYERNTTDGVHCVFPFQYQDELWVECVEIGGVESCKIGDGTWKECEPKEEVQSSSDGRPTDFTPRFALDGDECVFPLAYNGEEFYDCIEVAGTEQCKDDEGNWEECAPLEGAGRPRNFTSRFAVDGDECIFPLAYNGEELYNCIEIDGTEQCKDDEGNWEECAPLEAAGRPGNFTPRFAVDGDECIFPLAYNGEELYDCVEVAGTEQCKDDEGNWEECAPLEAAGRPGNFTPRFAVDGDECIFPLAYNGEEFYDCVEVDGTEQCKDEEGNWEVCAPLAGSGNPRDFATRVTVDGGQCVFPLAYNGEEFTDCIEVDGTEQCKDESGSWQECISQDTDRPIVALSEDDEEEEEGGDDSSISAGAIVGIIIAVLIGVLVIVLIVGFVFFKYHRNQDRNVEISRKHFERYEGGESDIAMATVSSKQQGRRASASNNLPL